MKKPNGQANVTMIKGLKTIFENNYKSVNRDLLNSLMHDQSSVFGKQKRNISGTNNASSFSEKVSLASESQTLNILSSAYDIDLNTINNVPNNSFEEGKPYHSKKKSRFRLSKRDVEPVLQELDRNCSSQLLLERIEKES